VSRAFEPKPDNIAVAQLLPLHADLGGKLLAEATRIIKREAVIIASGRLEYTDIWGDKWVAVFTGRTGLEGEGFRFTNHRRRKKGEY
jgi:hypothetical protein